MSIVSMEMSTVPMSHSVSYSCTFKNKWSASRQPVGYPFDAHWSPPVIAAHGRWRMWGRNRNATDGVIQVAETGATIKLTQELEDAQERDRVGEFVKGTVQFNDDQESQVLDSIAMTPWFDSMSSITMIAPSSDWFSGMFNIQPFDKGSAVWYESFKVATYPWDAGSRASDVFSSGGSIERPQVPIMEFTVETAPSNGVFLSGDGTEVKSMAEWKCELEPEKSSCSDYDGVEAFKAKRGCEFFANIKDARKKRARCRRRWKGERISTWCPKACGKCEDSSG